MKLLQLKGPPELTQTRERILRQGLQVARLVDDLLDMARLDAGKLRLSPERVELNALVRQAAEASAPLIQQRRHALEIVPRAPRILVQADPGRMEQVVSNLIDNAAKYTPEGGRIELSSDLEGGQAVVRVKDGGDGIPAADLPRLFQRFVQLGDEGRRVGRAGLGVGLSLVKSLVELHGGSVEARSEGLGRGSEFVVRLPALQAS